MKFCPNCGKELNDESIVYVNEAAVCANCGCAVTNQTRIVENRKDSYTEFSLLGFFIPLAGLILYIVYKDTAPQKASSAGKGALAGFIMSIVLSVFGYFMCLELISELINEMI